jgi:hypothetical protein
MVTRKTEAKPKVLRSKKPQEPKEPASIHLWTATDIAHWRDKLSKEQQGIDPITGEKFHGRLCLDHDHSKTGVSAQRVRGVLSQASNTAEGKIKAVYHRYLKYMTDQPLNVILRNLALYYERDNSHLPLHTSWIKTVQSSFSSLPEPKKALVLKELGKENGANSNQRKKIMFDCIKSKKYSYNQLMELIHKHKS